MSGMVCGFQSMFVKPSLLCVDCVDQLGAVKPLKNQRDDCFYCHAMITFRYVGKQPVLDYGIADSHIIPMEDGQPIVTYELMILQHVSHMTGFGSDYELSQDALYADGFVSHCWTPPENWAEAMGTEAPGGVLVMATIKWLRIDGNDLSHSLSASLISKQLTFTHIYIFQSFLDN